MPTLNPAYAAIQNDKIGCQADALMKLRAELWAVCTKAFRIHANAEGDDISEAAHTIGHTILEALGTCEYVRLDLEYALGIDFPKQEYSIAEFRRQEKLRDLLGEQS